jgi:threonine/homoserine/homoserine lactone efflux protein
MPGETTMNFMLFIIAAYLMGFLSAIPAGPVQIEVVRRAINGHLKASFMVILGALCSDVFYGGIAFFGIAPFLEDKKVMAVFWLAGGIVLIVLGAFIIRGSLKKGEGSYDEDLMQKKRWGFIGGLSLAVMNPMLILWWLSGVKIFKDVGLIKEFTSSVALYYLSAGSLGLASYLIGLSFFLYWAKKFISPEKMKKINICFGILLLLLAVYFMGSSLLNLLRP